MRQHTANEHDVIRSHRVEKQFLEVKGCTGGPLAKSQSMEVPTAEFWKNVQKRLSVDRTKNANTAQLKQKHLQVLDP